MHTHTQKNRTLYQFFSQTQTINSLEVRWTGKCSTIQQRCKDETNTQQFSQCSNTTLLLLSTCVCFIQSLLFFKQSLVEHDCFHLQLNDFLPAPIVAPPAHDLWLLQVAGKCCLKTNNKNTGQLLPENK